MTATWRAIVFDLDGTLTDSAPAIRTALNAVWRDRGRPPVSLETVIGYVGDGPGPLIERARAALDLPCDVQASQDDTRAFLAAYAAGGPGGAPYPGALETLQALKRDGWRLAVCTNKPQTAAETLLDALGFAPMLNGVVGGDAVARRKPDPAHALAALDLMPGVTAEEGVLVGDGMQDVTSAEAAGMSAIAAAYGYGGAAAQRPDLPAIQSIDALPGLLRGLQARRTGKFDLKGSI